MSTTPIPPSPASPSKLDEVLSIIDLGLKSASALTGGAIGAELNLADALVKIGQHAKAVYEAETGQSYDLSKTPLEDKI